MHRALHQHGMKASARQRFFKHLAQRIMIGDGGIFEAFDERAHPALGKRRLPEDPLHLRAVDLRLHGGEVRRRKRAAIEND